jgi:gluconolactonase
MTLMGTNDMSFFEVIDPAFSQYVLGNAPVKRIAEGFDWVEGPVWFATLDAFYTQTYPTTVSCAGPTRE